MSLWGQLSLQDANSSIMESMIYFYDHSMMILVMIIVLIFYMMCFMIFNKFLNRFILENQMIEIIWTVIPMFFLLFLAFPSLKILYLMDEISLPEVSLKILGHQWYWSYEYNDFNNVNFDSFMLNLGDYLDMFRLLDVDNRVVIPVSNQIRLLISSIDVIHSFALPSLGIKADALPGRINQVMMNINRCGLYYGQCSEICGVNHSFMPIVLEVVNLKSFIDWLKNF